MNSKNSRRPIRVLAVSAAALLTFPLTAFTQSTWDAGGADTNWSTVLNWNTDLVPADGTNVTFGTAGSTATVDTTSRIVGLLTINRDAAFTIAKIATPSLTINTGLTVTLPTATSRSHVNNVPVILGASQTWAINNNAGVQANFQQQNGGLSDGANVFSLTKTGRGQLSLTSPNSYDGDTIINNGTLILAGGFGTSATSAHFITGGAAAGSGTNSTLSFTGATTGTLTRTLGVTMSGGRLIASSGNSLVGRNAINGALTVNAGVGSWTVTAGTGTSRTSIQAASLVQNNNGVLLIRGTGLGETIASDVPLTPQSNVIFTTAPTLTGGAGAAATPQISILPLAVGDNSATLFGSGFLTYADDDATGAAGDRGLRLLDADTEYANTLSGAAAGDNVRVTNPDTLAGSKSVNALFLNNQTASTNMLVGLTAGQTLTVASGLVLTTNTIPNNTVTNLNANSTLGGASAAALSGTLHFGRPSFTTTARRSR